jgi:hypothetical protein
MNLYMSRARMNKQIKDELTLINTNIIINFATDMKKKITNDEIVLPPHCSLILNQQSTEYLDQYVKIKIEHPNSNCIGYVQFLQATDGENNVIADKFAHMFFSFDDNTFFADGCADNLEHLLEFISFCQNILQYQTMEDGAIKIHIPEHLADHPFLEIHTRFLPK